MKRLVPSLRKRWAELHDPDRFRLVHRAGLTFLVNYNAWADRQVVIHGLVERPQIEYLFTRIRGRACTMFLDIGAHMGIYAALAASRHLCGRVIAFEPDPRNYVRLCTQLLLNDLLDVVETHEAAVSNTDGTVSFAQGEYDVWSHVGAGDLNVRALRLDTLLSPVAESIAIKMDIEGHELTALAGMTRLLNANDCFLQIESFADNLPALITTMRSLGYTHLNTIAHDHYFARD